jgi:hypothetical protein
MLRWHDLIERRYSRCIAKRNQISRSDSHLIDLSVQELHDDLLSHRPPPTDDEDLPGTRVMFFRSLGKTGTIVIVTTGVDLVAGFAALGVS